MAQYKICHILLRLSLSDFLFCFLMKKYLHKKHHMNGGHHESKPRDCSTYSFLYVPKIKT